MRKQIVSQPQRESPSANTSWLDLESLARVEVTSEDAAHPIESALLTVGATGWRAESQGEQTVRLLFEAPQKLRRIRLLFREEKEARTQEFVLRWSTTESSWRDVVRQQYHFSPSGATEEIEEFQVELDGVAALELTIIPNLSGGSYASLARLRLA
jgi:F5/8 type C domain